MTKTLTRFQLSIEIQTTQKGKLTQSLRMSTDISEQLDEKTVAV